MFKIITFFITLSYSQLALANECPITSDNKLEKDRLHAELIQSQSEMKGRALNNELWAIWITAPDQKSQDMLDRGRERIRVADYEQAEIFFNDLIEYCPHYAEGWNQRAYVRMLQQNHDSSLDDIIKVLELEPRHFGALVGRAIVLLNMGRTKIGYKALRAALKVNPWLSERHLLPPGEDI